MGDTGTGSAYDIRLWGVNIPEEAVAAVQSTLKSGWINTGRQEALFRRKLREKFDFSFCVAVNNGTAALRASLAAIGVGPGDEVVTTPYTFIATNTAILEQGAVPVFADVKYDDCNIDPFKIEERITVKTRAIMCVHFAGNVCDMDEIRDIGRARNLPIIEDCAHALGSSYKGRYTGSFSDFACFSFQAIKMITSGDGGAIATTNEACYKKLKKLIWYGVDRESRAPRLLDPLPDDIDVLGFKYNMNDITATLGIAGLDQLETLMSRRNEIGVYFRNEFSDLLKIRLMRYSPDRSPNYWAFPIHVKGREEFALHMHQNGIQVNINNRRNDNYSVFGGRKVLPVTAQVDNDVILIPVHQDLSDEQVSRIVDAVRRFDRL